MQQGIGYYVFTTLISNTILKEIKTNKIEKDFFDI